MDSNGYLTICQTPDFTNSPIQSAQTHFIANDFIDEWFGSTVDWFFVERECADMCQASGYPVMLRLEGQRCVVVGGGRVAVRKVAGLLEAGAEVVVISPHFDTSLLKLAAEGLIQTQQNSYTPGMLMVLQPLLVFAATNSSEVNQQVVNEARSLNLMVNAVDDMSNSGFSSMAVIRRGSISIGIATNGASPALSAYLKTQIAAAVGEEYTLMAHWLAELRPLVSNKLTTNAAREMFWRSVVASPILEHLRQGDEALAHAELEKLWAEAEQKP
jgi:precorrin-2 dehydrogenase / sirohydrochlorin ferrochelatase